MPFINPYNFVRPPRRPLAHAPGRGWDRMEGLSGELNCVLSAETPLFIPSGYVTGGRKDFFRVHGQLALPAASLKGALRSLAEAISGGCSPFGEGSADRFLTHCSSSEGLCACCRLFGFMTRQQVLRGRVSFSDAEALEAREARSIGLVRFGQPKTTHGSFYQDGGRARGRKFFWHQMDVQRPQDIPRQTSQPGPNDLVIRPVEAGARFQFSVRYDGLTPLELSLLLWTLLPGGPRRNKVGFGKSVGLGTIHVEVEQWQHDGTAADLYESFDAVPSAVPPAERLAQVKSVLTADYAGRLGQPIPASSDLFALPDDNLSDLAAVLTPQAFADPIRYPSYEWFRQRAAERLPTVAETLRGDRLPDLPTH